MKEEYIEDIVKEVNENFASLRNERKSLELQWRLNMNFFIGNQYCEISPVGDIEDYGKQYFWQEREVYNHIATIIETRLAKLGRVKAGVSVRPFSGDDSDVSSAKLSTGVLKAITEENNLSALLSKGNMWSEVCGSVFYKVIWDSDKGLTLGTDSYGTAVKEGDIDITVCPPYEIFPDRLTAESIDELRYIIHAKAYTVQEIKDNWGVDVKGGEIDLFGIDCIDNGGGLGYSASNMRLGTDRKNGYALVLEKYERPSKDYLEGRHIIVCEDKLLHIGNLPFVTESNETKGLPFVRQVALESVANFYGTSVIERIIPLQRAYNSVKNRKHEFLNRIAMGVLAIEDGSVDTDNLEEEGLSPGKILVYRQGCNPPRMLEMGSVPNDFTYEESRLESEFMRISGVSEFMRYSKLPENVSSGIAISLVQEQDDTRISMSAESIRHAVKKIGQLILRMYKQMADNKRLKRIAGDNGDVELRYFNGSELASEDLIFDTDNELTETPANRRNMVFELIKMGILHDENGKINPRSKVKILEMLGFGNWENSRDIDECHYNKAMRENLDISKEEVSAIELDNHDIHISEHTKALINEDGNKELSEKLLNHIREHKLFLNMQKSEGMNEGN